MRRLGALAAGIVAAGLWAGPAAAEMVVFEADAEGLESGQKLADGTTVTLDEGETATLISESGETFSLEGPYEGVPGGDSGSGAGTTGKALAALMGEREASSDFLGATRKVDFTRPHPWMVDARHDGDQCIRARGGVTLWRPSAGRDRPFEMRSGDWRHSGTWRAEQDTVTMPRDAPVADGRTYHIDVGGDAVAITLHTVPGNLASPRQRIAWMLGKGCAQQAKLLAGEAGVRMDR